MRPQLVSNFPALYENSLPCTQQPATCPYPQISPVQVLPFYLLKIRFNIILPIYDHVF